MPTTRTLLRALRQPRYAIDYAMSMRNPARFWSTRAARLSRLGLRESLLSVSFDCDLPRDSDVVPDLMRMLTRLDLPIQFAAPAQIVAISPSTYLSAIDHGAHLINHGYLQHTELDTDGIPYASLNYRDLTPHQRRDDIVRGHESLATFTGQEPTVFRSPHFGTFSDPAELKWLHQTLTELGYSVSSSSVPSVLGSVPAKVSGDQAAQEAHSALLEVPSTGYFDRPFRTLDSWSLSIGTPEFRFRESEFVHQCSRLAQMSSDHHPQVLNIYFDPSHVVGSEGFMAGLELLRSVTRPVTLLELSASINQGPAA